MEIKMKTLNSLLIILILSLAAVIGTFAQTAGKPELPAIEVTGSAETFVTPNEFTFKITPS
jgi:hypothetical protein